MNFKTALFAVASPALVLAACEGAEKAEAEDTPETPAAQAAAPAEAEAVTEEAKPEEVAAPEPTVAAKGGKWTCEDQGDVEVTINQAADGSTTITYDNQSEMAMGEPAIVTKLEESGGSGRMTDAQQTMSVAFLSDGRAEVTEGEGEYRNSYMCAKAG